MSQVDPKTYWEERLRRDFDLRGVGFHGLGGPYNAWMYRVRRRIFRRLAAELAPQPASVEVLDVGSGTGFYIDCWRELGVTRIAGVDLTEVAVARLTARFPGLDFRRLDIAGEIPQEWRGRFDVVSAFDVFIHVLDDHAYQRALANVAALLKPDGRFVFSETFLHAPTQRWHHGVNRSLADIEDSLARAGLRITRRGPMFVLMNDPGDTRGPVWRALWSWLTLPLRFNRRVGMVTGYLLGALLYPLELALTAVKSEGPSTEFAICRKTGSPG